MHRESPPPLLREVAPAAGYSAVLEAVLGQGAVQAPRGSVPVGRRFRRRAGGHARTPRARRVPPPSRHRRPRGPRPRRPSTPSRPFVAGWAPTRRRRAAGARRCAARSGGPPGLILGGFVLVVLVALSIGRGLRRRVGEPSPERERWRQRRRHRRGAGRRAALALHAARARAGPAVGRAWRRESADRAGASAGGGRSDASRRSRCWTQLRAEQPNDADAPYLLATIDFDQRRWSEGLAAAQTAVRLNPELRTDGDLIRGADPVARQRSRLRPIAGLPARPRAGGARRSSRRRPGGIRVRRSASARRRYSRAAAGAAGELGSVGAAATDGRTPPFSNGNLQVPSSSESRKKVTFLAFLATDILQPVRELGRAAWRACWRR